MIFLNKGNPYKSTIIMLIISAVLSLYFIVQMFLGEYRVQTIGEKKENLKQLIGQYEDNQADLIIHEKKIRDLDVDNLDIDILEGEMREKMLFTKPNEILLIVPED